MVVESVRGVRRFANSNANSRPYSNRPQPSHTQSIPPQWLTDCYRLTAMLAHNHCQYLHLPHQAEHHDHYGIDQLRVATMSDCNNTSH